MRDIIDPVDTSDGLFHDGDPSTGVEGTVVHAKWLNAQQGATIDLQTEIKAVLSAAGMTPNSSTLSQLLSALQALFLTSESAAVKNALLKGNNLSDVVNKATALANLSGVPVTRKVNGHTFDKDFDISAADVKALAVTTVRAQVDPPAGNVADANYLPVNSVSFVYENVPNSPPFTGSLLDFSGLGGGYNVQIAARYANQGSVLPSGRATAMQNHGIPGMKFTIPETSLRRLMLAHCQRMPRNSL
ncbi:hypothetical protein VRB49_12775 [Erwinia aphidicola]|uniref:hypothetical protein n=1 Tax=Erwinia aphidicola TaxID=68334 RepID=UPI0030CCFDB1